MKSNLVSTFSDFADTEPYPDGNVLKMLLGSIWDWFDDDETESDPRPTSVQRPEIMEP